MDIDSMVSAYVAHGWDANSARADINAGGWKNKEWLSGGGSGGSSGGKSGVNLPAFSWDESRQKEAEANALKDLAPYYQKLLDFYGGDVALAKQRIDQDYERGLRVQTENTAWAEGNVAKDKVERDRKFSIALNDLDQQMNQRGVYTSGIAKQETDKARADEAYQQSLLDRESESLQKGLEQYKESSDVDYTKEMERLGYAKPVEQQTVGQYAPDQTGLKSPGSSYTVSNFRGEPAQKELALEEQKRKDMYEKALNARYQAHEKWADDATRLIAAG